MPSSSNKQNRSLKKRTRDEISDQLPCSQVVKKQRVSSEQALVRQELGLLSLGENTASTIQLFLSIRDIVSLMSTCKDLMSWNKIHILFYLVTRGMQSESEKILEGNPSLLLQVANVTDHVDRTFENIFILQYALWSLDLWMCRMLLTYLSREEAVAQINDWISDEEKIAQHGRFFDLNDLTIAYMRFNRSPSEKALMEISAMQSLLPLALIQEFANSKHPFLISSSGQLTDADLNGRGRPTEFEITGDPQFSYYYQYIICGSDSFNEDGVQKIIPAHFYSWDEARDLANENSPVCEDSNCPQYNPDNIHSHLEEQLRGVVRQEFLSFKRHAQFHKRSIREIVVNHLSGSRPNPEGSRRVGVRPGSKM